jgi:hypothetical protein
MKQDAARHKWGKRGTRCGFLLLIGGVLLLRGSPPDCRHSLRGVARAATQADVPIERLPSGRFALTGTAYRAEIHPDGLLARLQVGGTDVLRESIWYGDQRPPPYPKIAYRLVQQDQPAPDRLVLSLALPDSADGKPVVRLTYLAKPEALSMTIERQTGGYGTLQWQYSESVAAVESPARPAPGFYRLPGKGLVYTLPQKTQRAALRDMRCYLTNGRALDVFYRLADAPINWQEDGVLLEDRWRRNLINKTPLTLMFAPVDAANNQGMPLRPLPARVRRGIPYHLVSEAPHGLCPAGQPIGVLVRFPTRVPPEPYRLTYRVFDFQDRLVHSGEAAIPVEAGAQGAFHFAFTPGRTGWLRIVADLRPLRAPDSLPNQDELEVGVYTPHLRLTNPPLPAGNPLALTAALGLRCYRHSIHMTQWFPSRDRSPLGTAEYDWKKLDSEMQRQIEECRKWNINAVCQLNGRPFWADPTAYEELVRRFVTRYKNSTRYWEIENEPQDRYTPENYVAQALAPAFRGIKAADPNAVVMGPALVRVNLKWLEAFFRAEGARYLDAVSTHTYTGHNRSWEEHGNVDHLRGLRRLMAQYGAGSKPLWQTEQGYSFYNHAEMPRLHAAYLVRMLALAASVGIPREQFCYYYTERRGYLPFYLFDTSPNRAGMAARILAEQTAGMRFDREIPMGKYGHAVVFADDREEVVILWTDDFEAQARFRAGEAGSRIALTARDLMGNPIALNPPQSNIWTLPLSGLPIFVRMPRGTRFAPLDFFGRGQNVALAANGGQAETSSNTRTAAHINDGTWHFDDGQSEQKIWIAPKNAPLPQWAQVTFDQPRRIDTVVAITPSSNVALPGPAHYLLQVQTANGWRTVREARHNRVEWTLFARFPAVTATAARVVIKELNNGWWWSDPTPYTDMAARVYELEAYSAAP